MALVLTRHVSILRAVGRGCQQGHQLRRNLKLTPKKCSAIKSDDDYNERAKELTVRRAKDIFEKEFPDYFQDGKFVSRMSYVEFIDESLAKLKDFGLERDINAYKELLRIFPPGMFWPKRWDAGYGLFNAPQQLAAVRLLHQMQMNGVRPDKEIEKLIVDAFSKQSDVWIKIIRMNYWSMKGRNLDPNPLPETLPEEPHQLAKVALSRMLDDPKTLITVTNSSRVPTSVDKTWIVFSQTPAQKELIEQLPESSTLYVEQGGLSYVDKDYLSYYLLKYYVDDETLARKSQGSKPDFNYNTLKVKFFGKPIEEKLVELHERHYVDGSYVLGVCATGTSSQDSLLSWVKILEERNPKLGRLNIVFRMSHASPDLVQYQAAAQQAMSGATKSEDFDDEDLDEDERWRRKYTKKR